MGAVRFPEEQLTTYLRVFIPDGRIGDVLDQVAQAAVESDVQDEIELYALTHWLMDTDERRTPEVEAVVLVEEVGLDPHDVAIILDLQVEEVDAAVRAAWAEVTGAEPSTSGTDDPAAPEATVDDGSAPPEPAAEPAPGSAAEPDPAPEVEGDPAPAVEPDPGPEVEGGHAPAVEGEPGPAVEAQADPAPVVDVDTDPEPAAKAEPEPAAEADPEPAAEADPEPAVEADGSEAEQAASVRLAPLVPPRPTNSRPGVAGRRVVVGLSVLSLVVLAAVVFSSDGSDRLVAQGQNPLLWFGMVLLLLTVGAGILRATAEPSTSTDQAQDTAQDTAQDDAEVSAADPSDGPAAPSA